MKRMNRELAAIILGLVALQAHADETAPKASESTVDQTDPNRVVGKIGDQTIRLLDVTDEIRKIPPQYQQQIPKDKLYSSTLQRMALNMAVIKKARDKGIDQTIDYKKARQEIELNLLREMFLGQGLKDVLSEEGLKKEYDTYLKDFKEEDEVHARHILVKEESEAKEIIAQIKAGEDFLKIAEKKTIDQATAKQGGDLGFFNRVMLIPEFTKVAFDELKDGQMTDVPVKSSFGFHVIKREGVRKSKPLPFDKAKMNLLPNNVRQRVIQSKMMEVLETTKIELHNVDGSSLPLVLPGMTPTEEAKSSEKTEPAKESAPSSAGNSTPAPATHVSPQELGEEAGKEVK
jgi:peptidyl-prolyl cis-trans isomerase C